MSLSLCPRWRNKICLFIYNNNKKFKNYSFIFKTVKQLHLCQNLKQPKTITLMHVCQNKKRIIVALLAGFCFQCCKWREAYVSSLLVWAIGLGYWFVLLVWAIGLGYWFGLLVWAIGLGYWLHPHLFEMMCHLYFSRYKLFINKWMYTLQNQI